MQPVEAIRPLIALFLAGYFARRWEWLRELADRWRGSTRPASGCTCRASPTCIPVAIGMALVLLFFFFQHDLGPALVLGCTFLVTYSVARDRWGLAAMGLATLVGAFTAAYLLGYPSTVVKRIDMWHSPWDNGVSGGDQVAHALWGSPRAGSSAAGSPRRARATSRPARTTSCSPASARTSASSASRGRSALFGTIVVRGAADRSRGPINPTWRSSSSGSSPRSRRRRS